MWIMEAMKLVIGACGEKDVGKWGRETKSRVPDTDEYLDAQPVLVLP